MKQLLVVLLVLLAACAPTQAPIDLQVPTDAGKFARMTFQAGLNPTFDAVRDSLTNGTGDFLFLGLLKNREGMVAFWQQIAGQSARVYFKFETQGERTIVRVLTVPTVAPEPQKLARSLDRVGFEAAGTLQLDLRTQQYLLEPDR
jgi:hypothetical protein